MRITVIDVGTSSMRGSIYDEDGNRIGVRQISYSPEHNENGRIEQPAGMFENALISILKGLAAEYGPDMDAIAVTAQRSSVIPVDADGIPLMNTIMWQDTRNASVCKRLEVFGPQIAKRSGAKLNTVFSGSRMTWIKENCPEVMEKLYKFLNIPEYLIHRMTGEYVTDYTYGSRSHLMNLETCKWDDELLEIFGIEEGELCRLLPPGSICGHLRPEFAKECGLGAGIPVITAGGDQQCAAVGQGAYREGVVSIVTGTGAFLIAMCEKPPENLTESLICNCSSVRGKYMIEANVLTCCSAFDWFSDCFYGEDGKKYDRINEELSQAYDRNMDLIVLPYFQGRSTPVWNPQASGTFSGIHLSARRGDMLKALLEGIFLEIDNNIGIMRRYTDISSANISGGMTKSRMINQIQADVYGIPLYRLENAESTSAGALMVSLCTLGVCASVEEAYGIVNGKSGMEKIDFSADRHDKYGEKKEQMNKLYNRIYQEEI